MSKTIFMPIFVFTLLFLSGCSSSSTEKQQYNESNSVAEVVELNISAAASLTDALEEIKALYEEDHNVKLTYILGGSGKLAQQIQQGAPVDVFLSANQDWMDTLEKEDLLLNDTRADITGNKIVLITKKDSTIAYRTIEDIKPSELQQVAIGNPESVPAGQYTEQLLTKIDMWADLKDKIVFAQDVRQVLTYVETGNVEIGFVYESDALSSDSIKILAAADSGLHDPISYPATVLKDTKHEKEAREFVTFLTSEKAQQILEKHGFKK